MYITFYIVKYPISHFVFLGTAFIANRINYIVPLVV